jgi:hypothetical protein
MCWETSALIDKQLRSEYARSIKHVILEIFMCFNRFNPQSEHKSALYADHIY